MQNVLVDNATLGAVLRLVGAAPTAEHQALEGDYSALEHFLSALLLYEELEYVDDREGKSDAKRKAFPFLAPLKPESIGYNDLETQAKNLTERFLLRLHGPRVSDTALRKVVEDAGLLIESKPNYESADYLVMRYASKGAIEKYSKVTQILLGHEMQPEQLDRLASQVESRGIFDTSDDIKRVIASVNWLATRAALFTLAAQRRGAAVCLHPVRHSFLARWSIEVGISKIPEDTQQRVFDFLRRDAQEAINIVNEVVEPGAIGVSMPLVAAWAVGRAGSVPDAIEFVQGVRDKPEARRLRERLYQLEKMRAKGQTGRLKSGANRLVDGFRTDAQKLLSKYGRADAPEGFSSAISLSLDLFPSPSVSASVNILLAWRLFSRERARRSSALMRSIMSDVVGFQSLAAIRGKMASHIVPA